MKPDNARHSRSKFKRIALKFLCILALLLMGLFVAVRCAVKTTFSPQETVADIDSLVAYIERVHPAPYRNLNKADFYQAVEQAKERLSRGDVSILEFYDEASRLAAMFNEGHLSVPVPEAVAMASGLKLFPYSSLFSLEPGTHQLLLNKDCEIEGAMFKAGDELLAINGKPAHEIVEGVLQHVSAEGDGFRCARVNERDNMLDRLNCWLTVNMPADVYRVQMRTASDGVKSLDVKAVGFLKWYRASGGPTSAQGTGTRQPYSSKMLNDSTLLFSFNDCVTDGLNDFLSKMFAQARADGVRHLVIDNRYNTGGTSEAGDELCRYLTSQPFGMVDKVVIRFSEPIRALKREYLHGVMPPRDTLVTLVDDPASWEQPYGPDVRFDGKVYLLDSYLTFSAAADFASQFAYYKMGTIVGEETGGTLVSSGDIIMMRLPNTGLNLILPFKLFYNYGADENAHIHGVKPDIECPAEHALDVALDLIAGKTQ